MPASMAQKWIDEMVENFLNRRYGNMRLPPRITAASAMDIKQPKSGVERSHENKKEEEMDYGC